MKSYAELLAIKNEKYRKEMSELQTSLDECIDSMRLADDDDNIILIDVPCSTNRLFNKHGGIIAAIENKFNRDDAFGEHIKYKEYYKRNSFDIREEIHKKHDSTLDRTASISYTMFFCN